MTNHNDDENNSTLRQRAEQQLQERIINTEGFSLEDAKRLLHELDVHQIELELQNEALRMTQLDLETSRRKYIDLYEFSPVGLVTLDSHDHIQEANLTFVTMMGIEREKLLKRNLSDFIDPNLQDTYHFFCQALRHTQQSQQCEIILLVPNRPPLMIRLDGTVMLQTDGSIDYRIAITDITLQKQAESQRVELTAERLRTKVLAGFVSDISHDLRTPLSVISTGLYLIGKTVDKETQLGKIQTVQEHIFRLAAVLDQLQQMALLDSTPRLTFQLGDMNDQVTTVLHILKPKADLKEVKLVEQLQFNLPDVYFHADTMEQMLNILLDNALQFTEQGDVVSVKTYEENGSVVVEVSDNGIGIQADILPHIFDRLFKADESRHLQSGAGLGLAMAKRIVELHHGSIEVSSTPEVKTSFKVRIPSNNNDRNNAH